jgi:hypothetical protein
MPLDCVDSHRVFIHDRGGVQRVDELVNLNRVIWGRVRDDISEATIDISAVYCDQQAGLLNSLEPNRLEIVVYRGSERVWEGPISRLAYTSAGVSIFARDVNHYLHFLAMESAYKSYIGVGLAEYVIDRAKRILTTELTRKDVAELALGLPSANILPHIVYHQQATDSKTLASTVPMQYTVFEHMDTLAADYGMDYTVVGRALHLWDTHQPLGYTQTVTEADFVGDMTVTVYGMEMGTRAISTDGQGVYGAFGGADPYYGLWERLDTAYDEDTDDGPPPSQTQLQSQAVRNLAGRNPTPLQVRIPDNSTLNPNGVLSMSDLVPGVWVPMRATLLTRNIQQLQKLDSMKVTAEPGKETISVTLYPAPGDLPVGA